MLITKKKSSFLPLFLDKTRHYYTLCRAASPVDTPPCGTPTKELLTQMAGNSNSSSGGLLAGNSNVIHEEDDEGIPEMEYEDEFLDPNSVEFSSSNHHPSVESNEICEEVKEKEIIFEVPNITATSENTTTVEKNNPKNSTDQGLVNDSGKPYTYLFVLAKFCENTEHFIALDSKIRTTLHSLLCNISN